MTAIPQPPPLKPAPFTGDADITADVQKYVAIWNEGVGYGYDETMFGGGAIKVVAAEKGRVWAQMVVEKVGRIGWVLQAFGELDISDDDRVKLSPPDTERVSSRDITPTTATSKNAFGTLHGGVIASLVDDVTTFAIKTLAGGTEKLDTTNSVELSVGYLKAGQLGDVLDLYGYCPRAGRNLAFTSCDVFVAEALIAQGRHTKFVMPPTPGGLAKVIEDRKRKEGM
ncbi:Acyl-coenzyme A thioesterase 13, partial [Gonapodya sp. JEL0774]